MGWIIGRGNSFIFRQGGGNKWSSYWLTRKPTGLTSVVYDATKVDLNWTNNGVADYTGHKIYISTDNITYTLNATVASIGTTYRVTGLTTGTLYYFKVAAFKGTNISPLSNMTFSNCEPWYLSGSVNAANCKAVYTPYGAASLAASYVNFVNPGTNDASLGSAPAFDTAKGWTFNGSSNYLKTGLTGSKTHTMIIAYDNLTLNVKDKNCLGGGYIAGTNYFLLWAQRYVPPGAGESNTRVYGSGNVLSLQGTPATNGIMAQAGLKGYHNGSLEATIVDGWVGTSAEIYIGAVNANGSADLFTNGDIKAVAIYDVALTEAQIQSITNKMIQKFNMKINYILDVKIGDHACWGIPRVGLDPNGSGDYIVTWQKYDLVASQDTEVMYAKYDPITNSYTAQAGVFNDAVETQHQGHPNWGYFGNKYHVCFCQSIDDVAFTDGKMVDLESLTWEGFASHVLSPTESTVSAEMGLMPHHTYLTIDDNTVWLIYSAAIGGKIYVAYAIWNGTSCVCPAI